MIEFTPNQRKTIAVGLTVAALAVVLSFVVLAGWLGLKVLSFLAPAIAPVVLAFFLALFFRPFYELLLKYEKNPTLAVASLLALVLVPLGVLMWNVGAILVGQASNLIAQAPDLLRHVTAWFRDTFPGLDSLLSQMGVSYDDLGDFYTKYGTTALKAGGSVLRLFSNVITALVTIILFLFFLTSSKKDRHFGDIVQELEFLNAPTKDFATTQINAFEDILVSFFQRQTVICLIEGVMYGTGFWLVGLPYGFLIGFLLGVLNLIPLFGSVVCLPVALPLAYFTHGGSAARLVLVLLVWVSGQLLDGYLITPRIQGDKTGLGYAGVIFSFFFWGTILGPMLGMLLAIPLSAFCISFWRALKSRYIKPVI